MHCISQHISGGYQNIQKYSKILKVYCTLQSAEGWYIKKLKTHVTSSLRILCIMYNHNEVAMCCIMCQMGYVVSRTTRTATPRGRRIIIIQGYSLWTDISIVWKWPTRLDQGRHRCQTIEIIRIVTQMIAQHLSFVLMPHEGRRDGE